MAKYQTNIILIFVALLFFLPYLIPDANTTLLPTEDKYVVFNVLSPSLEVKSTNNHEFTMSIYRLKSDHSLVTIYENDKAEKSFKINDLTPGQYQIHLKSFFISTISISQNGFYSVSLVLLIFINAVNLYIFAKRYYFSDF